jgi:MFS superfamily sulfate permease-like transporter
VQFWAIDQDGVALITPIPSGLPLPVVPDLDSVGALLGGAFAIAIMCILETASAGAAVRRPDEPEIDNDEELVANGMSCVIGGVFQSMPSAGGFSQTAVNQGAGARTQLSEMVTVALAVACALFLGGVLSDLPQATLGCMVVVAVLGLIQPSQMVRLWRIDRRSFWIALATAAAGLIFGLLEAVLVGIVVTLGVVLYELNQIEVHELQVGEHGELRIAGPDTRALPGLLILSVGGPVYTANVRKVARQVRVAAETGHPDVVVLDTSATMTTSATVLDHLAELDDQIAAMGATIWLAALPPASVEMMRTLSAWQEWHDAERLHPTVAAALHAYRARSGGDEP